MDAKPPSNSMLSKLRRLTTKLKLGKPSRLTVFSSLSAFVFAGAMSIGAAFFSESSPLFIAISFILYFIVFLFLFRALFIRFDKHLKKGKAVTQLSKFSWKKFFIFFGVIFLCWLPLFLAYYPGIFGYDVDTQLLPHATTHHPIFHTITLKCIYYFGKSLSLSDNSICALMSIIQMLICGIIFAFVAETVREAGGKKSAYLTALFFGLLPACSFSSISITKDSSYAAFFVLSITAFTRILINKIPGKFDYILLAISLLFFILLRNNAPFIFVSWLVFVVILLFKNSKIKGILISSTIAGVLAILINTTLVTVTNAVPLQESAAFSVPLQLMLGTATRHPEVVPEKGTEDKLFGFFDSDVIDTPIRYIGNDADYAKSTIGAQINANNKIAFIKSFIKTGIKYPLDYLLVFARLTASSWYPFGYDYYNFYNVPFSETISRGTDYMRNIKPNSKIPGLKSFLDHYWKELGYKDNFVANFIMAPATYVLALILLFFYVLYSRRYSFLPIIIFVLLCYACTLLSPGILIRYMWPIMFSVPVLYLFTFCVKTSIIKPVTHTISVKSPAKRFKQPAQRKK